MHATYFLVLLSLRACDVFFVLLSLRAGVFCAASRAGDVCFSALFIPFSHTFSTLFIPCGRRLSVWQFYESVAYVNRTELY